MNTHNDALWADSKRPILAGFQATLAGVLRHHRIHYTVVVTAPTTLVELDTRTVRLSSRITEPSIIIPVWSGTSYHTVWGSPGVNQALRALHDWVHLQLGLEMTFDDEVTAAHATAAFFRGDDRELVLADYLGQTLYYREHGEFPEDQRAFVRAYLKNSERALAQHPNTYGLLPVIDYGSQPTDAEVVDELGGF